MSLGNFGVVLAATTLLLWLVGFIYAAVRWGEARGEDAACFMSVRMTYHLKRKRWGWIMVFFGGLLPTQAHLTIGLGADVPLRQLDFDSLARGAAGVLAWAAACWIMYEVAVVRLRVVRLRRNATRRATVMLAACLAISAAGCGRNHPAVLAEKATYDALAADYLLFTDQDKSNDPVFSPTDTERAKRTVETWRLRLEEELQMVNQP